MHFYSGPPMQFLSGIDIPPRTDWTAVIVVSGNLSVARFAHVAAAAGVAQMPRGKTSNAAENRPAPRCRPVADTKVPRRGRSLECMHLMAAPLILNCHSSGMPAPRKAGKYVTS